MSLSPTPAATASASLASSNYQAIFDNALEACKKRTMKNLRSLPLFALNLKPAIPSIPFLPRFESKSLDSTNAVIIGGQSSWICWPSPRMCNHMYVTVLTIYSTQTNPILLHGSGHGITISVGIPGGQKQFPCTTLRILDTPVWHIASFRKARRCKHPGRRRNLTARSVTQGTLQNDRSVA
ncbi:hypothetical protein BJV74DRAFT_302446 [Russula compacta]|nr:hypothetical protein BJV74DRAFT_302446 [Russula compacta]